MTAPSNAASAHGAQMAKYFKLNQPPHVAIDSAVSIVRPQLAITRLIARSGIPERTASIPAEKAYVVSVHLNHANSGEWELWTDEKYTKTGAWPVGGVAMCDLESNSSIRNPGPIDWVHFHVPRATLDSLTDDAGMRQVKRLHCVYGTPDPVLHHLTQSILPCLNRPEMFSQLFIDSFTMTVCSHLVGRYGQLHEPTQQLKGGLAPWQMRRAVELLQEHLDGELKLETMPRTRKNHPPSLKAKVAVEAIKAHKTAAQIAQVFGVHPTQVGGWKKQALAGLPDIFGNGREQVRQQTDVERDELYKQIGQLKVELDFLKKRAGLID
jgi:transposase-like protein